LTLSTHPSRNQILGRPALTQGRPGLRLALALLLLIAPLQAQTTTPYENRNLIVLDPAHGGQETGANLNGQSEKDLTLTLAASLKAQLTTRGFSVVSTRDADLPDTAPLLTTDQRAGIANHALREPQPDRP